MGVYPGKEKGFDTDFTRKVTLHGNYLYQFILKLAKKLFKKIQKS